MLWRVLKKESRQPALLSLHRARTPTSARHCTRIMSLQFGSCSSPVAAEANVSPEKKRKVNKTSYENHSWTTKTTDGYVCSVCQEFGIKGLHEKNKSKGTWVTTTPLSLGQSRKLSDKASKHANSAAHIAKVSCTEVLRVGSTSGASVANVSNIQSGPKK